VILIRCAAHIINLIVQIGFEEPVMSTANEKIRYYCKKIMALQFTDSIWLDKLYTLKNQILKWN
jgi:hypothetical protein